MAFAIVSFLRENWAADGTPGGMERWITRWFLFRNRGAGSQASNPLPATQANLLQGREIYEKHCAFCHGPDGRGADANGMQFYPPVPSLAPPAEPLSDGQIFSVVQLGIRYTAMPGFSKVLSEQELWKATGFVQSLATRGKPNPSNSK